MLTLMRKHAQSWLIKVLLGVIIVTFVISFGVGQFSNSKQVLALVGSEEILVREFEKTYQQRLDILRRQFSENADQIAQQQNLRKRVFDDMVNRALVRKAAGATGLTVTDAEVSDTIAGIETFQVEKKFNPDSYHRILRQNRLTPHGFEEQTREDLLIGKYHRHLITGLVVGKEEVAQRYRTENEQVDVEFFLFDPKSFLKNATSDGEAEKKYYEAHKPEFTRPPQAKVRYFVLPLAAVEGKVEVRDRAVKRHYERFLEEKYTTPKKVRASHILKKLPEKPPAAEEQAARAMMEGLLAQLRKGADFGTLARKHSEDLSKAKGGDLGFFAQEEMLPEFASAAFALKEGEISGIVRTAFGLHIIKASAIQPAKVKSFSEVRGEIVKTLKASRAERSLELELERLPKRIEKEGIETVAGEWKVKPIATDWLNPSAQVEGLGAIGPLAAEARKRKKGEAGVWKRNPLQGHVFFMVEEQRPSILQPLEEVRTAAAGKVKAERATEAAQKAAEAALKTITSHQDFLRVAQTHGFGVKTTNFTALTGMVPEIGFNREFKETGLALTKKNPVGLSKNGRETHLVFLKRRFIPESAKEEEAKKRIADRLEEDWAEYFISKEIERLKIKTGVEVVAPELVTSR